MKQIPNNVVKQGDKELEKGGGNTRKTDSEEYFQN